MKVTRQDEASLWPVQVEKLKQLSETVWPTVPEKCLKSRPLRAQLGLDKVPRTHFIVWEEDEPVAALVIYPHPITTARGELTVMALAGVRAHPAQRGRGLGRLIVEAAFGEVDAGRYPVSLFQTGIPAFYEKLGCRRVTNRFVNSLHPEEPDENPWWDENVMIYPASYAWPDGTIDLKGPGY